ncbi:cell surface glycoprotein [Colletotrichum chrysophilum]|uniref:Cell surface glycoprotein n=1 Tax=Colletotrichum chrysophilum TaxID=1836956 RepID=A0AAD9A6R6_9PEZI|nr:cell surface glycoprotein [Colletotrichum chrysophilum]
MKSPATLSIFLFLSRVASAAICNNNCGRQVAGTGRNDPSLASRSSLCAAFVSTYATVPAIPQPTVTLSVPSPVQKRNVHGPRQETPTPRVLGTKPAYASSCPDVAAYWSACQCFDGIKPTTIPVTAPTSVASSTASASCTPGAEFALHVIEERSTLCRNTLQNADVRANTYNLKNLVQGRVPVGIGHSEVPRYSQNDENQPINYRGVQGSAGSTIKCNILVHRGYLKASLSGSYEFIVGEADDVVMVWLGDKAKSGFNANNADITVQKGFRSYPYSEFIYFETVEEYIPFRIFWSNGRGGGAFSSGVYPDYTLGLDLPEGTVIEDPKLYASCSGDASPAPAWPAWQDEVWG